MNADLLSAGFYIATGLGFALFLAVATFAQKVVRRWPERWFGFGLLVAPLAPLFVASALKAGPTDSFRLMVAAGAVMLLSSILVAIGLFALARRGQGGTTR